MTIVIIAAHHLKEKTIKIPYTEKPYVEVDDLLLMINLNIRRQVVEIGLRVLSRLIVNLCQHITH